jgi:hypothetical protein
VGGSNPLPIGTSDDPAGPLAPDLAPDLWHALRVSSADFELAVGLAKVLRAWPALPDHVRRAIGTLVSSVTAARGPVTGE